ncbi:MAG: hypothetical protein ACRD12_11520 [Acidimicrobiales bacterium]
MTAATPAATPDRDAFVRDWNALPRQDRLRMRRMVRLGRPVADAREAKLAVAYGTFQRSRPWTRFFWLWFIPGVIIALGLAGQLHPLFVGVVIMLAAQGVFTWFNLRRVERVNAALL